MGKDCTSPQLGVHFISKECQQGKTVSQGHKDSSEILCLRPFPHHHIRPRGGYRPWKFGHERAGSSQSLL